MRIFSGDRTSWDSWPASVRGAALALANAFHALDIRKDVLDSYSDSKRNWLLRLIDLPFLANYGALPAFEQAVNGLSREYDRLDGRPAAPKKRRRKFDKEKMNEKARQLANHLQCCVGYACKLSAWKKLMERRNARKTPSRLRVQSLPQSTSIGEGFGKTYCQQQKDAVLDEVIDRERQEELQRLIAEQEKDFEPSPRDEGNYEVRVRKEA